MKPQIIVLLVIGINCQSVLCAFSKKDCTSFKTALDNIHELLEEEAETHGLNLEAGGKTYISRTEYILNTLNSKIKAKPPRNSQISANCKLLEVEILAKSKEFGIEKIGLEDNLTRLRKIFNYQDDRYRHQLEVFEESENTTQACEKDRIELESLIQSINVTHNEQIDTIKQLKEQIKMQEKKYQKLQAKLNANAPAIHGGTGAVFGDDKERAINVEEVITETLSSNTTTESMLESQSASADIDVRNGS